MNATVLRRLMIAGAVGTGFLAQPSESYAIFSWFKSCCQPATPCAAPVQVAQYVPQTSYRTQYVNVPVTTYKPVSSCGPCGNTQVSYMPVTTYQTQAQLVPYTSYRIVYSNVVAAQPVVANYAVAVQPAVAQPVVANYAAPVSTTVPATPVAQASCCGGGSAPAAASTYYRAPTTTYYGGSATGYSAYSAPVYNGAGFGPPSAGMPVGNSTGNVMQSATTGSSLTGVAPTLSPGSPFANGTQLGAPTVPMPAQPMYNGTITAPAAAQPMPSQPMSPSPSAPAPGGVPMGGASRTYAEESPQNGTSGTNGAAKPVVPNDHRTLPPESAAPITPIPHEDSNGTSADPTSGPSIVPPSSRTTQSTDGRTWAYRRLSYLPGETAARDIQRIPATVAAPLPATTSDGWRPSSR
ncbi:MAG: hypothetical protein JNG90_03040 [Planctomycetaceae bacterium]|nr:hypothetical protein [Planctomycetaceae bacterium]